MPAYPGAPGQPPPGTNVEARLTDVWNAFRGLLTQQQPHQDNAYVQAPQNYPMDDANQKASIATIAISVIAAILVVWLVKSLLPLLISGGAILIVATILLFCFHNARNQSRTQAFEANPNLHDHYAV